VSQEWFANMTFMDKFRKHAEERSRRTHCHAGHPLTPGNTRKQVCIRGGKEYVLRICKACERDRQKDKSRQ
jgi:hypothetical protein